MDHPELTRLLRATVRGQVRTDPTARATHATDASNYRQLPLAVVAPRDAEDVAAALAACRHHGVPLTPRGAGTSVAGNACGPGVLLDTRRHLDRILDLDPGSRTARVQPGVTLDDLQRAAAPHGLRFGPDPSTHARCTLGGMIGNNACGSRSLAYGTTADNVEELDVIRYDSSRLTVGAPGWDGLAALAARPGETGRLYAGLRGFVEQHLAVIRRQLPDFGRRVSGYALDQLLPERGTHLARALVGTEGSCVTVVGATLRLVPEVPARVLLVLGYPDPATAADAVPAILAHRPLAVEGIDATLVAALASRKRTRADLPPGGGWLLVELGGQLPAEARSAAHALLADLGPGTSHRLVAAPAEQQAYWRIREEGAGIVTRLADGSEAWPGWEDAAVPPQRLGSYLRAFAALTAEHGLRGSVFGHFGEGCVHVRLDLDLAEPGGGARLREFVVEAARLVVAHGGSVSGEHGDGRARSQLLALMYPPELLAAFDAFKAVWDPDRGMNPHVVVDPAPVDADLRFTPGAREPLPLLAYPEDAGSFARAVRRCVGVGKCVQQRPSGAMCPSYPVTGAEEHSTRGRARLLAEMLRGEDLVGGWRSPAVRDALDLCLGCKACARDCPVQVDMATYKVEFLARHHAGRIRPAAHYSMGWLPAWARAVRAVPGGATAANALLGGALAPLLRRLGGIAAERALPALAGQSFTDWYRRRPLPASGRPRVLLWPDTFTNHFDPGVGQAAVRVLAAAGFEAVLPDQPVCCGLTWYSTGQLAPARRVLRRSLRVLAPWLRAGLPVVGLEPSCVSALREDAPRLLPDHPDATALAGSVHTLGGFLREHAPDWAPGPLGADALTQVHCHQYAGGGYQAEEDLLAASGVANRTLPAGCCGLAGNFGFERGHHQISVAIAERTLLPAVRAAGPGTLLVADGFSCRTQIRQLTGRRAVHLAQVLDVEPTPTTNRAQGRNPLPGN